MYRVFRWPLPSHIGEGLVPPIPLVPPPPTA